MKGLDLSRSFYEEYGRPMLERDFAKELPRMAIGLVGHGSECFGFDDEVSRDHDFEPGFCIWLTEADQEEFGFRLFRAYGKLPKEYLGVKLENPSVLGSKYKGVHTISEFYSFYTGSGRAPESVEEWLAIPDFYLAEATNGEVFTDPLGEFTRIRDQIRFGCPEDVWRKKLASEIFYMAQCGQYNYRRVMAHGEKGAAGLCVSDFVRHTAAAVYLMNHAYAPYYKWLFRGMEGLSVCGDLKGELEKLLESPYDLEANARRIEAVSKRVMEGLAETGFARRRTGEDADYLEGYAYDIRDSISDHNLRNMPVMI